MTLPLTVSYFLCQFAGFCACFLYLSFFEWAFHRYAFHTPLLNRAMFHSHTLVHHQVYKSNDTYHTDQDHPEHVPMHWTALPVILLCHLPLFFLLQWVMGLPLIWGQVLAVSVYYTIYESIHWAMHVPRAARLLRCLPLYRFLDAHHRTHHKYLLSNLNVVLPLADWMLGTLRVSSGSRVRWFRRVA